MAQFTATTPAINALSITLNLRACLAAHNVTIPGGGLDVMATLRAAGEMMSGGANRAAQSLRIHIDPQS